MATIFYTFSDGHCVEIEVTDEFAARYAEMEHRDALVERKETRRHQSLDKSLEHGFDLPDSAIDVQRQAAQNETAIEIHNALHKLTDKQRTILLAYTMDELSFREIGERMGIRKETAREHYLAAVKKMKKLLTDTLSNGDSRGF